MREMYIVYHPQNILEIFQANYIQQQLLDADVLKNQELNFDTSIESWRDICNLIDTDKLYIYLNQSFNIAVEYTEWMEVLHPEEEKTIGDVCKFISSRKQKTLFSPIKLFGQPCHTASIYRYFVQRLQSRGVNTKDVKPSSTLENLFSKHGVLIIEEINLLDPKVLPTINYTPNLVYKWSSYCLIASIILTIITALLGSNIALFTFAFSILSYISLYISSYLAPKRANFNNLETLADAIRKVTLTMN